MTLTPTAPACPACDGTVMPAHPAGLLAVRHRAWCGLRDLEDARHAADLVAGPHTRPATVVELTLLSALYAADPPDTLTTVVELVTASIVRRSWPTLPALATHLERTAP